MKNTKAEVNRQTADSNRREFLKKSTLTGVGVAAAATLPGAVSAGVTAEEPETKQQKGYQLTDHVVAYYKSAAS